MNIQIDFIIHWIICQGTPYNLHNTPGLFSVAACPKNLHFNTLRTGDAGLHFYITTVQDGWRKSAFLTRACFPCTIHLIMQYIEPVSEWSCWRMFVETWPNSELTFRHRASSIEGQPFRHFPENAFYIFNQQIYLFTWYLLDDASLI